MNNISYTPIFTGNSDAFPGRIICINSYKEVRSYMCINERICENISDIQAQFKCSECGDAWRKPSVDEFNYCPTCGAKVVNNDNQ